MRFGKKKKGCGMLSIRDFAEIDVIGTFLQAYFVRNECTRNLVGKYNRQRS
jgi:hypothetical protein